MKRLKFFADSEPHLYKSCITSRLFFSDHKLTTLLATWSHEEREREREAETSQAFMLLSLVVRLLKQLLQSFATLKKKSQLWPGGTMVGVHRKRLLAYPPP